MFNQGKQPIKGSQTLHSRWEKKQKEDGNNWGINIQLLPSSESKKNQSLRKISLTNVKIPTSFPVYAKWPLLASARTKTSFSHAWNVLSFQHLLGCQHHEWYGQLLSPARKSNTSSNFDTSPMEIEIYNHLFTIFTHSLLLVISIYVSIIFYRWLTRIKYTRTTESKMRNLSMARII